MAEPEERYVTVDVALLQSIRELLTQRQVNPGAVVPTFRINAGAFRLIARLATIDEVSGRVVLGIRLFRDLDDQDEES
jgi:hypothetical protein